MTPYTGVAHDADTADLVRRVRVTRQGVYDARRQLVAYRGAFSIAAVPGPRSGKCGAQRTVEA